MGLNSDKSSKVFCISIGFFLPDYIFFVTQWHRVIRIVDALICTPHKYQNVYCAVSSNDQYQGNGFTAQVLLGRDHPRVVSIGPIVRGVIAFPIVGT